MNKKIFLKDDDGMIRLVDRKDGTVLMSAIGRGGERRHWETEGATAEQMAKRLVEIGKDKNMKILEVVE